MKNLLTTLFLTFVTAALRAQDELPSNRADPDSEWYDYPTLWIALGIGLVVGLLVLRKKSAPLPPDH